MLPCVSPRKIYSFYINEVQAAGLKAIKRAVDMTESEQIRQALNAWIRKWERRGVIAKTASRRAGTRRKA